MIKLDVADYCRGCPDFEADIDKPAIHYEYTTGKQMLLGDVYVRCEHRQLCERLKSRWEEKK